MNYTSAAIGVIGMISLVTWLTTGRKHFTGPRINVQGLHTKTDLKGDAKDASVNTSVEGSASGAEIKEFF